MKTLDNNFQFHYSTIVTLNTTPQEAFKFLDDPMNLSSHMDKRSWMMAGSRMDIKLDSKNGKGIGAEIIMEGKILTIPLFVREFVTETEYPFKKVWQTEGPQKLIIINQYKMGFTLSPDGSKTRLEVFIDYSRPQHGLRFLIGILFSKMYAKWCTTRMASDAVAHFKDL